MKKLITIILILTISTLCFSQQLSPTRTLTKLDYLKKSKKLKTTGRIILGSGLALSSIGFIVGIMDDLEAIGYALIGQRKVNNTGIILFTSGMISIAGSIPFFIASGKNKKKARSLSYKNEPIPRILNQHLVYSTVPSLSLKISL